MALVRARIKTGNKVRVKNMGRALAEASDNVEILEGEPTHKNGRPLGETFESGRPVVTEAPAAVEPAAVKKKATARSASDENKE